MYIYIYMYIYIDKCIYIYAYIYYIINKRTPCLGFILVLACCYFDVGSVGLGSWGWVSFLATFACVGECCSD